jgi:hypothetical protein
MVTANNVNAAKGATMTRTFDAGRKAQGFTSQAHLDAFFASFDHVKSCADCHALNGYALLDDGLQPTQGECREAKRLLAIEWAF